MEYIVGIDEAGRGPLAGPVAVGVVFIPKKLSARLRRVQVVKFSLRDSKTLPEHAREEWFACIKAHPNIFHATAMVHPKTIDRINITQATNLAATRALKQILKKKKIAKGTHIFIDYGIKPLISNTLYNIRTVVRADQQIVVVQLAAIAAKVRRDRYMKKQHEIFPEYGFHKHKGYGTETHRRAIRKLGPCPLHRLTFIEKYTTI